MRQQVGTGGEQVRNHGAFAPTATVVMSCGLWQLVVMTRMALLLTAALATSTGAVAQGPNAAGPQLQVSATFNDITTAQSSIAEKPVLIRKPELAELDRTDPARPEEFGLSFNCAVSAAGSLSDCRLLYKAPDKAGADDLIKALAPLIRLSPASAASARSNDYRVTISAAREVMVSYGTPRTCLPPFCMVEGAVPPPPPPYRSAHKTGRWRGVRSKGSGTAISGRHRMNSSCCSDCSTRMPPRSSDPTSIRSHPISRW